MKRSQQVKIKIIVEVKEMSTRGWIFNDVEETVNVDVEEIAKVCALLGELCGTKIHRTLIKYREPA